MLLVIGRNHNTVLHFKTLRRMPVLQDHPSWTAPVRQESSLIHRILRIQYTMSPASIEERRQGKALWHCIFCHKSGIFGSVKHIRSVIKKTLLHLYIHLNQTAVHWTVWDCSTSIWSTDLKSASKLSYLLPCRNSGAFPSRMWRPKIRTVSGIRHPHSSQIGRASCRERV